MIAGQSRPRGSHVLWYTLHLVLSLRLLTYINITNIYCIVQTPTPIPHGGGGGRGGYTCSMQWSARACHDNNYTFCWTAIIYYIQDINAAYIKFYHCDDYFYRHHCCCWTLAAAAPRKEICLSWWLSVHVSCCNLKINTKIYIPLILEYIIKTSVNSYPF